MHIERPGQNPSVQSLKRVALFRKVCIYKLDRQELYQGLNVEGLLFL